VRACVVVRGVTLRGGPWSVAVPSSLVFSLESVGHVLMRACAAPWRRVWLCSPDLVIRNVIPVVMVSHWRRRGALHVVWRAACLWLPN
jgi:hypothetical protein